MKTTILTTAVLALSLTVFGAPPPPPVHHHHHHHHHDHGNSGVRLAAEIVGVVNQALRPAPVVVTPQPVVVTPQPVVVTPQPVVVTHPRPVVAPQYAYDWYNGYWVPTYNGWYWYNNVWVWNGGGSRPRYAPAWVPDPRRPAPPAPIPQYSYGWYNGYWVPTYNGWYWHNSVWIWNGGGPRPHRSPAWRPDPRRPVPPPPGRGSHGHHHRR